MHGLRINANVFGPMQYLAMNIMHKFRIKRVSAFFCMMALLACAHFNEISKSTNEEISCLRFRQTSETTSDIKSFILGYIQGGKQMNRDWPIICYTAHRNCYWITGGQNMSKIHTNLIWPQLNKTTVLLMIENIPCVK